MIDDVLNQMNDSATLIEGFDVKTFQYFNNDLFESKETINKVYADDGGGGYDDDNDNSYELDNEEFNVDDDTDSNNDLVDDLNENLPLNEYAQNLENLMLKNNHDVAKQIVYEGSAMGGSVQTGGEAIRVMGRYGDAVILDNKSELLALGREVNDVAVSTEDEVEAWGKFDEVKLVREGDAVALGEEGDSLEVDINEVYIEETNTKYINVDEDTPLIREVVRALERDGGIEEALRTDDDNDDDDNIPLIRLVGLKEVSLEKENNNVIQAENSRCRKRKRYVDNWKRNVLKRRRNEGVQYVTEAGNLRKARTQKTGCGLGRLKCDQLLAAMRY